MPELTLSKVMSVLDVPPTQRLHAVHWTLVDLPDELLARILSEASEGEIIYFLPKLNQRFRPFWSGLRRTCSKLRRVANDPLVIVPSSATQYIFSSPAAVEHLDKLPRWLGVVDSYAHAYGVNHEVGLSLAPQINPRHIFITITGRWKYIGQAELERWSQAVRDLPDLVSIDVTWVLNADEREPGIDYFDAVIDTINGATSPTDPTARKLYYGLPDMRETRSEMEVRFHLILKKSGEK